MIEVIGVTFEESSKIYYFSPNNRHYAKDSNVIVETERGMQFGKIATDTFEIDEKRLVSPLKPILRIAGKDDLKKHRRNLKDAGYALNKCRALAEELHLKMQVLDASYTFDRSQLMFRFLSDVRVDFRALAKKLASVYHTRIELRQVGVRDKAKEVGGIGSCGRELCCAKFLHDFDSVSISMAKNQNIALNPTKINGLCGRLLCCLKYEDECYTQCKKILPKVGSMYKTEQGEGKVIEQNILERTIKVDIPRIGVVEVEVKDNGSRK